MIVLKSILWIIAIAAVVGVIAGIADIGKKSSHKPYGPYERFIKRPLDAFLATGALIVLSPIWIMVAILVRVKLGSPILFTQDRPGKDEKIFKLYKFRTMTDERDENGNLLPDTVRLTEFGKKLRSTSLDELPQLLNIIRGDMALIGPRALLIEYLPYYNDEEKLRHTVRPGLTNLVSIHGRNAVSVQDKFNYDIEYLNHISFLMDLKIFSGTIAVVLKHEGTELEGGGKYIDYFEAREKGKTDENIS